MKIFLDSAIINEIEDAVATGFIEGITTNPSLMSKSNLGIFETLHAIVEKVNAPISVEVIATSFDEMLIEATKYAKLSKNIVIKTPVNKTGFMLARALHDLGIKTNLTLCFSPLQALLAGKCGATFISPFIGRIDDIGRSGIHLIQDIKQIYANYDITTQILGASIRNINHVIECAKLGVDCVTVPFKIFNQMFDNVLTNNGIELFLKDWNSSLNK